VGGCVGTRDVHVKRFLILHRIVERILTTRKIVSLAFVLRLPRLDFWLRWSEVRYRVEWCWLVNIW